MKSPTESAFTLLLLSVILIHLSGSPFTKVEESFNIQATHDILAYGVSWNDAKSFLASKYDHVDFPGSVPRTFVGAVVLACFTKLTQFVAEVRSSTEMQMLVRGLLGLLNATVLLTFRNAIHRSFGMVAGNWFVVLQASQFHVMYYASRTLPNMFAFTLTTLALRSWVLSMEVAGMKADFQRQTLILLTFAGVVFRSELAVLVFSLSAFILYSSGRSAFLQVVVRSGVTGLVLGLLTTVPVDSYFWQKYPTWPEWSSFYYNTILGNASNWGTSPWHFYFSNALPRLLLNPLAYTLLIPIAIHSPATRARSLAISIPLLHFVAMYSLLPHKEWRFILYVVPGLTSVAAIGAAWIWQRRTKSLIYRLLNSLLLVSVLSSFAASFGILLLSQYNYPGGVAITQLKQSDYLKAEIGAVRVFADNLACQTGVTRFLEGRRLDGRTELIGSRAILEFDKTEDKQKLLDPVFWTQFKYALAEHPETLIGKWEVVSVIRAFGGVKVLEPGEELVVEDLEVLPEYEGDVEGRFERILVAWMKFSTFMRKKVTRGWWVTMRMDPKLRILRRLKNADEH